MNAKTWTCVALATVFAVGTAQAVGGDWIGDGGNWSVASKWLSGEVPGTTARDAVRLPILQSVIAWVLPRWIRHE